MTIQITANDPGHKWKRLGSSPMNKPILSYRIITQVSIQKRVNMIICMAKHEWW